MSYTKQYTCCRYCGSLMHRYLDALRCTTPGCPNCVSLDEEEAHEAKLDMEADEWIERHRIEQVTGTTY